MARGSGTRKAGGGRGSSHHAKSHIGSSHGNGRHHGGRPIGGSKAFGQRARAGMRGPRMGNAHGFGASSGIGSRFARHRRSRAKGHHAMAADEPVPMVAPIGQHACLTTQVKMPRRVFFPGNVVEGLAEIQVTSPVTVKAVRLELVGQENVPTTTITSQFLKSLVTLAGESAAASGNSAVVLPPGIYTYPFAFPLPGDLPPTCNMEGAIEYYVEMSAEIGNAEDDAIEVVAGGLYFTVVRPMPAGQWANPLPYDSTQDFQLQGCCSDKGTVKMNVHINRTVVALDRDTVNIQFNIDNSLGKSAVRDIKLTVQLSFTCVIPGGVTTERYPVANQTVGEPGSDLARAGEQKTISGTVTIPKEASASFRTPNITSTYSLVIELGVDSSSQNYIMVPLMVCQTVDEQNIAAPLPQTGQAECAYSTIAADDKRHEVSYVVPPQPCGPYVPIPNILSPSGLNGFDYRVPSLAMPVPQQGVWSHWDAMAEATIEDPSGPQPPPPQQQQPPPTGTGGAVAWGAPQGQGTAWGPTTQQNVQPAPPQQGW